MKRFVITEYTIESEHFRGNDKPVTICFLSDLHNYCYGKGNAKLLDAVAKVKPDLIVCAGDMLIGQKGRDTSIPKELMCRLARRYPVYYGNGNHESRMDHNPARFGDAYKEYEAILKKAGVHFLKNDHAVVPAGKTHMRIYGYDLPQNYYKKRNTLNLSASQLTEVLGEPKETEFNLLIAHNPVYGDAYAQWGADLTVGGHLHGGIIRIPGIGGLITPQARFFPKYDAGIFTLQEKRQLIVSRGLGGHTVNIRIFNPAELVVIRLMPPADGE